MVDQGSVLKALAISRDTAINISPLPITSSATSFTRAIASIPAPSETKLLVAEVGSHPLQVSVEASGDHSLEELARLI